MKKKVKIYLFDIVIHNNIMYVVLKEKNSDTYIMFNKLNLLEYNYDEYINIMKIIKQISFENNKDILFSQNTLNKITALCYASLGNYSISEVKGIIEGTINTNLYYRIYNKCKEASVYNIFSNAFIFADINIINSRIDINYLSYKDGYFCNTTDDMINRRTEVMKYIINKNKDIITIKYNLLHSALDYNPMIINDAQFAKNYLIDTISGFNGKRKKALVKQAKEYTQQLKAKSERINIYDIVKTDKISHDVLYNIYKYINTEHNTNQKDNTLKARLELFYKQLFNNLIIDDDTKRLYDDFTIHCGLGGALGAVSNSIFVTNSEYDIVYIDVSSFFPFIVCEYGLDIPNIPEGKFLDTYKEIYAKRINTDNKTLRTLYKSILNKSIGLTNNQYEDILYCPSFFYSLTINGQLFITSIYCDLKRNIPNIRCILLHTDGLFLYAPKNQINNITKILNKYKCSFKVSLFSKIVIKNFNSYIAVSNTKKVDDQDTSQISFNIDYNNPPKIFYTKSDNDIFCTQVITKGIFNFDDDDNENYNLIDEKIIKKALYNYYVFKYPITSSVFGNNNHSDFVLYVKNKDNNIERQEGPGHYIKEEDYCLMLYYSNNENINYVKRIDIKHNNISREYNLEKYDGDEKKFAKYVNKNAYICKIKKIISEIKTQETNNLML